MADRNWNTECKVYIGGLRDDAKRYDLEDAFAKYGPVRDVWVARRPPGFAFVEMEDARDAEDAARGLNGATICGSKVKVEMSSEFSRREDRRSRSRDYSRRQDRRSRSRSRDYSRRHEDKRRDRSRSRYRDGGRDRKEVSRSQDYRLTQGNNNLMTCRLAPHQHTQGDMGRDRWWSPGQEES